MDMSKELLTLEIRELIATAARRTRSLRELELERRYEKAVAALRRIKEEKGGREALIAQAALKELWEN
jgi:hypothetical protein